MSSTARLIHSKWWLCTLAMAAVLIAAAPASAQSYRLVELQPLPGDPRCEAIEMTTDLRAVGTSGDFGSERFVIWDANGVPSLLPVPPFTRSVRINNRGGIAGTRGIGPPPLNVRLGWPSVPFVLTDQGAVDLPGPPGASVIAEALTDTGILLLSQNRGFGFGSAWAVYQGQVYHLTDVASGAPAGISDAGFFGFNSLLAPLVQRPGEAPFAPWPEVLRVQRVGPGGHAIGGGSLAGGEPILYRSPEGVVTRFVGVGPMIPGRLNHAGDVVGRLQTMGTTIVFRYLNGQLSNLTDVVPGRTLRDATQITDSGAMLVWLATDAVSCGAYLVPVVPDPPSTVTFRVTQRTVTLEWSASVGATDYIVEAGSEPSRSDLFRGVFGSSRTLTVTAPPGRYFVRVRARNENGESRASEEILVDVR